MVEVQAERDLRRTAGVFCDILDRLRAREVRSLSASSALCGAVPTTRTGVGSARRLLAQGLFDPEVGE
ncbi:MAG TPA: hypothetical protein VJU79_08655 [Candidatus Dormibacteraeota bacterium]|nr:hypothetical protein [Candidatus Dormibacteraeota bacterium]